MKPVFERHISDLLFETFRTVPAFALYAFYVAVLLWVVSWLALAQDKSLLWVLGNAALIGAMGYGTYDLTNLAVMKDWTWGMVLTDLTWGTALTAVSATGGVYNHPFVGLM